MSRDFSTRRPERGSDRGDLALLAAGLVAVAGVTLLERRAAATEAAQRAALEGTRSAIVRLERRAGALEAGRGSAEARAAGQRRLTVAAPPGRVLAALASPMPAGVRLDALDLAYGPTLEITAGLEALEESEYDRYVERLDAAEALEDVRPDSELRDGAVSGGVVARWREP